MSWYVCRERRQSALSISAGQRGLSGGDFGGSRISGWCMDIFAEVITISFAQSLPRRVYFRWCGKGSVAISGCEEEWRGQASGAVFCAFWESCFSCPDGSGGSRCPVSPTTRGRVSLNIWSRRMSTEECPAAGFPAGSLRQSFERNIRMLAGYR